MTRTQRSALETQRTQRSEPTQRTQQTMETVRAAGSSRRLAAAAFVSFVLALCSSFVPLSAVDSPVSAVDSNDWPSHDHDAGGRRFSPLKQISPANVAKLQRAWTFDTGAAGLQVTPLAINGIM